MKPWQKAKELFGQKKNTGDVGKSAEIVFHN